MFRIDTGQARTDLYGIGKGAAQVIDLSPLREQAAMEQKMNFQAQQAEKQNRAKAEEDIYNQVSKLDSKVFFRDRPAFVARQNEIADYVRSNIGKLKSGDTDAHLEFSGMVNDFNRDAGLSKIAGDQWHTQNILMQKEEKEGKSFRRGSKEALQNFISEDNIGNFDTSKLAPQENINYMDRVLTKLAPYAERAARSTPFGKTFGKNDAEKIIEDDLLSDPTFLAQANEDYTYAENKLGAKDPVDYYKKLYADKLVVNDTAAPPEWMVNGDDDANTRNVTVTTTDDGEEIHVMDPKTNQDVLVKKDAKGNVIGGEMNTKLTAAQKSANDKVLAQNAKAKAQHEKQIRDAELFRASLPKAESQEEIDEQMKQFQALLPKPTKLQPLPYPEQKVPLSAKEAQEVAYGKYGVNVSEVDKDNKNYKVQRVDNRSTSVDESTLVARKTKDGKIALFDPNTKKFVRWK